MDMDNGLDGGVLVVPIPWLILILLWLSFLVSSGSLTRMVCYRADPHDHSFVSHPLQLFAESYDRPDPPSRVQSLYRDRGGNNHQPDWEQEWAKETENGVLFPRDRFQSMCYSHFQRG